MVVQQVTLESIPWLEKHLSLICSSKLGLNLQVSRIHLIYQDSNFFIQKLVKGVAPSPRAAHASTNVEQMQMVVYGGATGGGSLASDDLYLLDMRNGEE